MREQLALFTGIEKARFRHAVVLGDQLVIKAEMVHFRHNAGKVKATALVDDVFAAEAVMSFGLTQIEE